MSLPWLRLYTEIIDDPKTGTLSDAAFRSYIELLCIARQQGDDGETGMTGEQLDWKLRRNVTETLQELLRANLVTLNNDKTVSIPAFVNRQKKSDTSAERVRKHRENKKKAGCNVTETGAKRPKSKKEIEKESNSNRGKTSRFAHPTLQEVSDYCRERGNSVDPQRFVDYYASNGWMVGKSKMKDWKAAVRNWEGRGANASSNQHRQSDSEVGRVKAANAKRAAEREAALSRGRTTDDLGRDPVGAHDRVVYAPVDEEVRGYANEGVGNGPCRP